VTLDNLISALRQEVSRIDEAIVAVEHLMEAHEEREKAAAAFDAGYGGGANLAAPAIQRLRNNSPQEIDKA
jgi:hypothetical protein